MWIHAFGWLAVILTATQFLPQAYKSFKTKSTKDLSWWTFFQTLAISVLWIIYGFQHGAIEIIIANVFVNISCDIILIQKYFNEKPAVALKGLSTKTKYLIVLICLAGVFVVVAIVSPSPALKKALGWFTVFLNVTQFMPQAYKSFKTKSTQSLSWWTFIQVAVVTLLWIVYGFVNCAIEIIVTNSIVHLVCDAILLRKYLSEKS